MSIIKISNVFPSTFVLKIPKSAPIDTDKLNGFFEAVSTDIGSIADKLNTKVIASLNRLTTLTDGSSQTKPIDGKVLYIDEEATLASDYGIFATDEGPITIKEGFLLLLQILANTENGLREGELLGDVSVPYLTQSANTPVHEHLDWPYTDGMFECKLFKVANSVVTPAIPTTDYTVSLSTLTHEITITTVTDGAFFGYIWHPVFTF